MLRKQSALQCQCLVARCGKRKNQPPLPPLYFLMITFWGLSVWPLLGRVILAGHGAVSQPWRHTNHHTFLLLSLSRLSVVAAVGVCLSLPGGGGGNHAHETQIARSLAPSFNLLRSALFAPPPFPLSSTLVRSCAAERKNLAELIEPGELKSVPQRHISIRFEFEFSIYS